MISQRLAQDVPNKEEDSHESANLSQNINYCLSFPVNIAKSWIQTQEEADIFVPSVGIIRCRKLIPCASLNSKIFIMVVKSRFCLSSHLNVISIIIQHVQMDILVKVRWCRIGNVFSLDLRNLPYRLISKFTWFIIFCIVKEEK